MGIAQIVAGQARTAVQAENGLLSAAETVSDEFEPIDLDLDPFVRTHLTPHA